MPRGQASIRLDGLDKARRRIKVLNKRATDRSISMNFLRIAGGYNVKQCPIDTSELLRSFTARIHKKFIRLIWKAPYANYVNDPHDADGKPIKTTARGFIDGPGGIGSNTARDIAKYAETGKKPRLKAARRFGNNRNSV